MSKGTKVSPILNRFNSGEVSGKIDALVDYQRYGNACRILENMIPIPQGGAMRRPGTYYVYATKDSTKVSRLVGFHFSTIQAYVLEFGEHYIRVYMDHGIVLDGASPYEIVTTYDEDELFDLKFVPSNDVMYILHPDHTPAKLTRSGHTSWTLTDVTWTFDDPETITGATQANPCVLTVTGHSFVAGDEVIIQSVAGMTQLNDRLYRVSAPATNTLALKGVNSTGYGAYTSGGTITRNPYSGKAKTITGVTKANPAVVSCADHGYPDGTVVLIRDAGGMTEVNDRIYTTANATTDTFELSGVDSSGYTDYTTGGTVRAKPFTATNEYPSCGAFFEQRLLLARDQTVWGSRSGDYENFQAGTDDDHAWSYTIASDRVDTIQWMIAQDYAMLGTIGGVWKLWGGSTSEPITPSSVTCRKQTGYGCMGVEPEMVDDTILFVQRGGRRVRELGYSWEKDGYVANDMTKLAEHIGKGATAATSGIADLDYQSEPFSILWCVRNDGQLLGLVRDRVDQVAGWCRVVTGKESSIATDAIDDIVTEETDDGTNITMTITRTETTPDVESWDEIESVAVISNESEEDEVWITVKRTVDGSTVRYVEYFKPHEFFSEIKDCFFVDSGLTYDGGDPVAITGITQASPAVVTALSHGLSDGNKVRIYGVAGMTEVNQGLTEAYTVAGATTHTFQLSGIDSSAWTAYTSGGYVKKVTNTITGLDHLEGRTVDILMDGARHPAQAVASGEVSLQWYGNLIHAGLQYQPILQPMKVEVVGGSGSTSVGRNKRVYGLTVRFHESYGCMWGPDADHLDIVPFGAGGDPVLFSGDQKYPFDGPITTTGDIYITQQGPFPMTILAIIPNMEVF